MKTNREILESYGFKLVTRQNFECASDVPEGLRERAALIPGAFVLYDPEDDDEGYMLVRDNADAAAEEAVIDKELEG